MEAHVVIATDLTLTPPNVGHMMPMPGIEVPVNIEWAAGANSSYHMLAVDVLHKGHPIAQAFHDCGLLIPHLSPLDIGLGPAQSSRQVMFSAMDVMAQGEPIGFAEPLTPMLTCGLVPMPTGMAPGSLSNEVIVGMSPRWDFALCWAGIGIEMTVMAVINAAALAAGLATGGGSLLAAAAIEVAMGLGSIALSRGMAEAAPGRRYIEGVRGMRHGGGGPSPTTGPTAIPPSSWDEI